MPFSSITNPKEKAEIILKIFNVTNAKPGMPGYEIAKRYADLGIDLIQTEFSSKGSAIETYYEMIREELKKL